MRQGRLEEEAPLVAHEASSHTRSLHRECVDTVPRECTGDGLQPHEAEMQCPLTWSIEPDVMLEVQLPGGSIGVVNSSPLKGMEALQIDVSAVGESGASVTVCARPHVDRGCDQVDLVRAAFFFNALTLDLATCMPEQQQSNHAPYASVAAAPLP